MIYLKNDLVLGVIFHTIKFVLKIIFKVIGWLHLWLFVLCGIATLVLYLLPYWSLGYVRVCCYIGLCASLLLAIVLTLTKGFGGKKKKKKEKGAKK